MHAGDGNVHTNIPVNSDNYEMLQTAHEAVARIMKSGAQPGWRDQLAEHGIGITKLEFLTDDELAPFTDYKQKHRPRRPLQQGQAAARLCKQRAARLKASDLSAMPTRPASA